MAIAFTLNLNVPGRGRVTIAVPVGMTVGQLEDILHDRYRGWSVAQRGEGQ